MPDLVIANVPDGVYARLKAQAAQRGTTIEEEAARCLLSTVGNAPREAAETLAQVRALRASLSRVHVTDADLSAAKTNGRE